MADTTETTGQAISRRRESEELDARSDSVNTELLAALINVMQWIDAEWIPPPRKVLDRARAAIAKARGTE